MKHTNNMKRYIAVFILVIISAAHGFAYDANQAMEEADTYLRNGQYLEAVGAYRNISDLASDPEMKARAILRVGDIYSYFLNNYSRALDEYTIVIKKYGNSVHAANAYYNSGMILYEENRYREALEEFRIYLQRYPRGDRRETAEFMIETCLRSPPVIKDEKPAFTSTKEEIVRVLLMTGIGEVHIDSPSPFEVRDGDGKDILGKVQTAVIRISGGCINLNGNNLSHDRLVLIPSEGDMLRVGGSQYRGKLKIQKSSMGNMDVINILEVEAYLYGVVPKEMSPQWPLEALKAQAIAARTYALYQNEKNKDREYDMVATTTSQVYGGKGAESERSNKAVNETKGMVLLSEGRLALTYFHANSGGMTEDAKNVWTVDVPYLKAVRDDYSLKAPNCSWKLSVNVEKMRKSLNIKGFEIGRIERLIPLEVSPSGRLMRVKIFHGGRETILTGNDFRIKIDPTQVKSTLLTMINTGDEIRLEGKGYGHGVGMSQWGAYIMAREGHLYGDILKHYYGGLDLR